MMISRRTFRPLVIRPRLLEISSGYHDEGGPAEPGKEPLGEKPILVGWVAYRFVLEFAWRGVSENGYL